MGNAERRQKLSKLFSAFTRAEAQYEVAPRKFRIRRFLRRMYAKWLLRRAGRLFETYQVEKGEMTPLALIIGASISFHSRSYLQAAQYAREVVLNPDIGADQRALALAILAECHEMIGNSKKPEDSFKIIFAELYYRLEPITQIRVLRSRAGFEGRRGNIKKSQNDIARARKIVKERGFADELIKLEALEIALFKKQ